MIGGDAWAAACVEIARWEGPTADIASARDLLHTIDERGGVLTSSFVALVPRVLGVAQSLTDDLDAADDDAATRDRRRRPHRRGGGGARRRASTSRRARAARRSA